MASKADRFRKLGGSSGATSRPQTADLFEHFGVEVEHAVEASDVLALDAGPCRRCGWYLATQANVATCPVCGAASPLSPTKNTP
ncbi:MAG: hypothetical protein AAGA54_25190 [Myxococcota bacterium]